MSPHPLPSHAHPGLPLAKTSTHAPGDGTHIFASQIIASRSGKPVIIPALPASPSDEKKNSTRVSGSGKPVVCVPRLPLLVSRERHGQVGIPSASVGNTNRLPRVGDVVLARVVRVRVRQVEVGVLCVGVGDVESTWGGGGGGSKEDEREGGRKGESEISYAVNADAYPAIIRREDVRATEKEKVVTSEGFRVGDLVRAVVISLGDQANYYLSTARNEYGVLMAKSEDGNAMVPISWREFRDEVTGRREGRKVAKPF